jgi:hypothetical protein
MTKDKQQRVLQCFAGGKYRVNGAEGRIESYRKAADQWLPLAGHLMPNGYRQLDMSLGRGKGPGIMVYEHIAVWLGLNGEYEEGRQVDHINRCPSDNRADNLRIVTPAQNLENRAPRKRTARGDSRVIRGEEIAQIRQLHADGHSQSAIGRALDLHRLSVRYVIKRIENGEELKYENWLRDAA